MKVAKALVKDIKLYFAEPNAIKRDEIAGRQLQALKEYQSPREKPVRTSRRCPKPMKNHV
jgi:hypothetical protein